MRYTYTNNKPSLFDKELYCCICGNAPTQHWYNGKKYCLEHLVDAYSNTQNHKSINIAKGLIYLKKHLPVFFERAVSALERTNPELLERARKTIQEKRI